MLTPEQERYLTEAMRSSLRILWRRLDNVVGSWGRSEEEAEMSLEEAEVFVKDNLPRVWGEEELRAPYRRFYPGY